MKNVLACKNIRSFFEGKHFLILRMDFDFMRGFWNRTSSPYSHLITVFFIRGMLVMNGLDLLFEPEVKQIVFKPVVAEVIVAVLAAFFIRTIYIWVD